MARILTNDEARQAVAEQLATNTETFVFHSTMWAAFHQARGPFKRTSRVQVDHNALMRHLARTDRVGRSLLRYLDDARQRERGYPKNRCEAKTKKGTPCQAPCVPGKLRCKFHGGMSTGPRTEAGRAAIAESNRRRAKKPIIP